MIDLSNLSHLTLANCSFSTGLRSEGTRKGLKFWIKTLIITLEQELAFRGTQFHVQPRSQPFGALKCLGSVFTLQHWEVFQKVTEVFILVPALLGLKGNLEMTLASRLSTAVSVLAGRNGAHRGVRGSTEPD